MNDFDAPHKQIHSLADQLLNMKDQNQQKSLEIVEFERKFLDTCMTLASGQDCLLICPDRT